MSLRTYDGETSHNYGHRAATNQFHISQLCSYRLKNHNFMPTIEESLLSWRVKTKHGLAPRQQDRQVGIHETKTLSPHDWQSMVDLFPVADKTIKKNIVEILSKHMDLWSRCVGNIKATHQKIDQEEEGRPILQQPYFVGRRSLEMPSEHIDKQQEAGVIDLAKSECARPVVLVFKKDGTIPLHKIVLVV